MIPFQSLEQRCIEAALDFANLRTIPSAAVVHSIFQPVSVLSQPDGGAFQVIPEEDIGAFVDDKTELTEWLLALVRWSKARTVDRRTVHEQIEGRLGKTVLGAVRWEIANGALHVLVQPQLTGVQACYSFAAALLADENEKRWRRLGRCALTSCGKWFWEREIRGGPTRKFCTDAHAAAARKLRFKSAKHK